MISSELFSGIYGIPEAALYLSHTMPFNNGNPVSTEKLRYWIRTSVPVIKPLNLPIPRRLISFNDLISMRMVAIMRSRNVSLKDIRAAELYIREKFDIQYPFINRDVWTYGSDVFVQLSRRFLSASRSGQEAMEFLGSWMSKVELDMCFDDSGFVESWTPYADITLNPKVQIGMPCISGTRIPTRGIWRKLLAGDEPEVLADLYDLSGSQIKHVIEWEARLERSGRKAPLPA
ncbi:MAG: DUF433 domain-containing protein [Chloroflexi bacterium]|nr:DUF433 domain-containing protein [Chloroflexota bacterium]